MSRGTVAVWLVALLALAAPLHAQSIAPELLQSCTVRAIGPAAPGGRIVDVAVHPDRPFELWAASASGGLWKSVNNGTTWSCVFDRALSLGDVAVAPTNPDVIWLATGEGNNQRSSYAGNGVWRSIDGGANWSHVGLEETQHIARIVVDPRDADVAYIAALGHLYTPNDERGLYRTGDGGRSWERILHLGEAIGIADVVLDPGHPDTIYVASYERRRRAWNFEDAGRSAIYRTLDRGLSWKRLAGGLPEGKLGRIGLALFPSDPKRLYACIDDETADADGKTPGGEVWRTLDGGESWEKRNEKPVRGEPPYYYGQIRVDPHDPESVWVLGIPVFVSKDGGKTFTEGETASSLHSDHHALWFDPARPGRLLLGNDGGLAQSYDGGKNWDYFENLPITQFYTVSVDLRRPYQVYGGLQDNGIWTGPSRSRSPSGAGNGEWKFIGGGDGMYVLADPNDPDTVYLESQFGALQRTNVRFSDSKWIQPPAPKSAAAEGQEPVARPDRYNWCSPLVVSSHNSQVLYFGAQCLWKSLDRGDHWKAVSGDLTTNDPAKVKGNVPHCTLTTISESPLDPDLLLVGSDDGNVQWTDDGGRNWTNLAGRFPDLPSHLWCSRVELSRHDPAIAWVAFSGFREDDFTPYVYRTRDGGKSFERAVDGLPEGPVNVVHESPRRPNVLFLGSDAGAFFSLDGGARWQPLASGLPTVSVLDLVVHPRERDVVLGTHGRGFYVVDVTPIEQFDATVLAAAAHLFEPDAATMWKSLWGLGGGWNGERKYRGANPEVGTPLWYWLGAGAGDAKPELEIVDEKGKVVRHLEAEPGAGLHRVTWDFRFDPPKAEDAAAPKGEPNEPKKPKRRPLEDDAIGEPGDEAEREGEESEEEEEEREEILLPFAQDAGARRGRRGGGAELAPVGTYTVRLRVGERTFDQELRLLPDPAFTRD